MADTGAERQRRSRAHKRGDHSLCDPSRCRNAPPSNAVTPVTNPPPPATERPPPGLAARGRRLWRDLTDAPGKPLTPAERVLLEEACRLADRLDRLDRILQDDDDWMRIRKIAEEFDGQNMDVTIKVLMTQPLSEARQQQIALKAVLGELRQSRAAATKAPAGRGSVPAGTPTPRAAGGGGIVDLSARIAQRKNT